jgi:hypothetical protein
LGSSVGAVADLLDISCLYGTEEFAKIQDDAFDIWQKCPDFDPLKSNLKKELFYEFKIPLLGYHYFIIYNGTLRPDFDFTSTGANKGNKDAFVVAAKAVDVPAPNSVPDVDWLELKALSGKLADAVYRVDTRGGQPPTNVSSLLYSTYSIDVTLLCSAPQDQVRSPSSILQNTVSAY